MRDARWFLLPSPTFMYPAFTTFIEELIDNRRAISVSFADIMKVTRSVCVTSPWIRAAKILREIIGSASRQSRNAAH